MASYLRCCLTRLLAQILDGYENRDSLICVIHQENRGGQLRVMQDYLSCNLPYIGFVNSGDWIDTSLFEEALQKMQENNVLK